jgi:hypothetical protein
MPSFWLWLVVSLKAMVEVAALSLLAQGMLRILAGKSYRDNFVYRLFQVVTAPVLVLVRKLTHRRDTLEEIFLKAMGHIAHTPGESAGA